MATEPFASATSASEQTKWPASHALKHQLETTNEIPLEINLNVERPASGFATIDLKKEIDTQFPRTVLRIRANLRITGLSPPDRASPQFLAVRRRERSRRIANAIAGLAKHAEREDFVIWTRGPLHELKKIIHFIDQAEQFVETEHEGNACEVFRQLRDTFLAGGWERYREEPVRAAAIAILKAMATADEVTAEFADETTDRLLDLNLEPAAPFPIVDADDEEG